MLSLEFPVLLGPVRVETRFTATELLIRVFPDEWSVNKFEPKPTQAEVAALGAYWTALWASGRSAVGERAAWEELVARVPAGRAHWLLQGYKPANLDDRPTVDPGIAVLVVVSPQPLAAADRQASVTYWTSVWRAHGNRDQLRDADIALLAAVGPSRADAIRALRPSGVDRAPVTQDDAVVSFLVLTPLPANEIAPQSWTVAATAQLLPDKFLFTGYVGEQEVFSLPGKPVRPDLAVSPDPAAKKEEQLKINEADGTLFVPPKLLWLTKFGEAVEAGMGIRVPLEPSFTQKLDRLVVLGLREQAPPEDTAAKLSKLMTDQLRTPAGFSLLPQGTPTNNTEQVPAGTVPPAAVAEEDWATKTDGQWFTELLGLDPALLAGVPNADGTDRRDARAAHTALWPSTWGHYLQGLLTDEHIAETRKFFVEHVSGRGPLPAVRIGRQPYGILPTTVFTDLDWPDTAPHRKALNAVLLEAARDWTEALRLVEFLDGPTTDVHQKLLDILALHPTSAEYHFRPTENALEFAAADALTALASPIRDLLARFGSDGDVHELFADVTTPAKEPVVDDRPLSEVDPIRTYTNDGTNYLQWMADYAGTDPDKIRDQDGFIDKKPPSALLYLLARQAVLLSLGTPELAEQIDALKVLAKLPTARLERVFAEHLDAATYRLDAWRLGLVNERLAELRADHARGLHLGAYGWLENIERNEKKRITLRDVPEDLKHVFGPDQVPHDADNGGYIHAPSPSHARTAAVLRAGYLANGSKADANMFAVNLSSNRVRVALTILDGMRQGQSLGALLGYRFERGLHDRRIGLDKFIADLRVKFPLRANKIDETSTDPDRIEQVEARNVIDGLLLLRHVILADEKAGEPQDYPWGLEHMEPADGDQKADIRAEIDALLNVNDALADLAVAEGTHQALQGNTERASATLDAYAKEGLPPEPAVVDTPRSGTTLTHRFAVQFTPGLGPDAGGPLLGRNNPRARAEPAVYAWLRDVLPAPDNVVALVTWKVPGDPNPHSRVVTQAEAGLQELDLLWALRPVDEAEMSDLDDRILGVVIEKSRPRPDIELAIEYTTRVRGKVTFFELSPLIASLRTLLTTSRPLRPTDLVPAAGSVQVSQSADDAVSLPRERPAAVLESLNDLVTEIDEFLAEPPATVDTVMAQYAKLNVTAGGFGLVRSGWGELAMWRRGVYKEVLDVVAETAARMRRALEAADKILDYYDDDLPSSTPDQERFRILVQAERLLTTKPEPRPSTPFRMRFNLRLLRDRFESRLEDLEGIARTSETTLSGLLDDVAELLPVTEFDPAGLDIKPFRDRAVAYRQELLARAGKLKDELVKRRVAAEPAFTAYDKAVTGPDRVTAATDALKALLGADVLAVPEFTPQAPVMRQWRKALDDSDDLLEHLDRDFPVDDWLHGMARVREMPRQWEKTITLAEALGSREPTLSPIQLPYVEGDHWLGMEFAPRNPEEPDPFDEDRLLFTAHYADDLRRDTQCGLVFDEWTEVIPAERETTGIAVHYDRPDAEPPQAMLLVVPPVRKPDANWTPGDLIEAIKETFAMAKTRAVEPEHLDSTAYAHLLPAIRMEGRP